VIALAIAIGVATVTGFIALSWEIVWFRAFSFATGTSPTVFGILLAAFLAGTASGSYLARKVANARDGFREPQHLGLLGWILSATSLAAFFVVPLLTRVITVGHWGLALPLVFVATLGWGFALPMVAGFAVDPYGDAGRGVSYIYFGNIVGCVVGTLLTGLILFDVMPLKTISIVLGLLGQLVAIVLIARIGPPMRVARMTIGLVILLMYPLAGSVAFDEMWERLQWRKNFQEGNQFTDIIENRAGVITVTNTGEIYGGGAYDGVISTDLVNDRNGILRAYALSGFHPAPRRVLMIGLSGGAWAEVIANIPSVEELVIVEINRGYLPLVARYPEVAPVLSNQKVKIVIDDGRRWMARNPFERFDAIVANTTFHWRANATNLLSVEYLELCRSHLRPGGILFYNTTLSDDALVTGMRVFPFGYRYHAFALVSDSPVVWDGERFRSTVVGMVINGRRVIDPVQDSVVLSRAVDPGPQSIESRSHVLERLSSARTVTDDNMVTEWRKSFGIRVISGIRKILAAPST
jgi:spermidine synthase